MNNTKKICILATAMIASLALNAFPHHHYHHHRGTGFAIGAGILGAGRIEDKGCGVFDALRVDVSCKGRSMDLMDGIDDLVLRHMKILR